MFDRLSQASNEHDRHGIICKTLELDRSIPPVRMSLPMRRYSSTFVKPSFSCITLLLQMPWVDEVILKLLSILTVGFLGCKD